MKTPSSPRALGRAELFDGLSEPVLMQILSQSIARNAPGGEFFILEGDCANSLFVLESGQVAVLKSWQGKQFVLDHLAAGACFGEVGVLDLSPRSASVLAVEDSHAIEIPCVCLQQVLQDNPQQFAILQMNMARALCRRFRHTSERLFHFRMHYARGARPVQGEGPYPVH